MLRHVGSRVNGNGHDMRSHVHSSFDVDDLEALAKDVPCPGPDGSGRWNAVVHRKVRKALGRLWHPAVPFEIPPATVLPGDGEDPRDLVLLCLRLGHAMAFRYVPDDAAPEDVEDLRHAWRHAMTTPSRMGKREPRHHVDHVETESFTFRHVWPRPLFGQVVPTIGEGQGSFVTVDLLDAPVVALLDVPGGALSLRMSDGRLLRPVTAPLTWRPCDVATFLDAVAHAPAWADSPSSPWPGLSPLVGIEHVAAPAPARPNMTDRSITSTVSEALAVEVGDLVVCDGVVHRACPVPMAGLVRLNGPSGLTDEALVRWSIPGSLKGTDDLGSRRTGRPYAANPTPDGTKWRRAEQRCLLVPLQEASRLMQRSKVVPDWRTGNGTVPFRVTRPDLWPTDRGWALDGLAAFVDALDATGRPEKVEKFASEARRAAESMRAHALQVTVPDPSHVAEWARDHDAADVLSLHHEQARSTVDGEHDPELSDLVLP